MILGDDSVKKLSIINLDSTKSGDSKICAHAFEELEIPSLLNIMPRFISGKMMRLKAIDFFVTDIATISHRLDLFDDLLEFKEIYQLMVDILPIVSSLREMVNRQEEPYRFIEYLYSVRELRLYTDCITKLYDTLSHFEKKVRSAGLKVFTKYVKSVFEGEEFQNLKSNLESMDFSLKPIRSITVGINLNLNGGEEIIADMGILSINAEHIKSGKSIVEWAQQGIKSEDSSHFIAKIDALNALTPLESMFKESRNIQAKATLNLSCKKAINTVLKKTLKNVEFEIFSYVQANTAFLADLLPELIFLIAGVDFITKLRAKNVAVCKPQISDSNDSYIKNLINPILLTSLKNEEIQANDVSFNENGMIHVLTGANSGGKSVFLQSVGIAQALFQLGLYIPATKASLSTIENIIVHFPSKSTVQIDGGRLEQECKMINESMQEITEASFVLMDETFSSTSAYDASILAEATLKHLAIVGCKGIFSTHIHHLDKAIDKINEDEKTKVKVDSLLAVTTDGSRTYRIERGMSEGHSHAKDIAKKYGLLFDFFDD